MKKWTVGFAVLAMVLGLSLGFSVNPAESGAADVIKWGVLIDLSGPTSDWGKNQAKDS